MKYFSVTHYDAGNIPSQEVKIDNDEIDVNEATQDVEYSGKRTNAVLTVKKNQNKKSSLNLVIEEQDWDKDNYVFAPAALYNGNRFESLCKEYPPMLTAQEAQSYSGETVISDVPRLNRNGDGYVQLNSGDLSLPCVGYYSDKNKLGCLLFFEQKNELGNLGITVKEDAQTGTAKFILSSPCVRTPYKYEMCSTAKESDDEPVELKSGDRVTFSYTLYRFECNSICEFLNLFFQFRQVQELPKSHPNKLPWSCAFKLVEDKYNKRNWVDGYGFYKSSEAEGGICSQWQTGWVGGAMNTLPGFVLGNSETKDKSCKTLDFVFTRLQHKSGFLYGLFCDGKAYGDNHYQPDNPNIVLSRKDADALYYIAKQLLFLRDSNEGVPDFWQEGLRRLADAFVTYYKNNGEISQFIDMEAGKPYASGSSSAGIVCAGLALCSAYFNCSEYLQIAENIGEDYYREYISKGISTGGPGEILSCPDSESAFALLESFVVLYRFTQDKKWLNYAVDTASLCASWCVGYDYAYKSDTQLFERGTATTGAVWANLQNKHAAPGICTMSGESLLHLYRATGDMAYLELLKDISHNITQYVSTPENPIYASYVWHNKPAHMQKLVNRWVAKAVFSLFKGKNAERLVNSPRQRMFNPTGRVNERVNLSDWEGRNNVGEIPIGSCWCEVSVMLTYLEIPAVYIQRDTGFCFSLDHIECSVKDRTDDALTVEMYNPTDYDANYRIFIDSKEACSNALPPDKLLNTENVFLPAGERKQIKINRR
ncbi:hypothetical protein [Eubacterium sp.]|uniref:hypothetical protein n=1 Tax=Eubacterium sp. TaxID=142586 RepID=UPI003F0E0A23